MALLRLGYPTIFQYTLLLGGENREGDISGKAEWRRRVNDKRIFRFSEDLKAWTYDEVRSLGIEANVANFRNGFRDLYDSAFPWVKRSKKKKDIEKPWLDNHDFKVLVKEKGELYSKKIKNKLDQDGVARLAEVSKQVNAMRQKLKRRYFRNKLEDRKGDLRKTWEVLGEVLKGRAGKPGGVPCRYFEKDGQGITDGNKIAKGFCDFYCKVGPELAKKIGRERNSSFTDFMGNRVTDTLFLRPTTPKEIEELCKSIEASKGMGWDGISPRVIKAVAKEISDPLSRLFNSCMREGYFPTDFKVARVVPVFKSEDQTQFSNYRPVSVLPALAIIFEKVLKSRLVNFLDQQEVIIPGQYGFRAGHSTAMAILDMVERVRAAWADKDCAIGVFIDLKKAFDTVDHDILLQKMEHYGIRGQALKLLASYLKERTQYVCYGGYESERGKVECGVPQGSVLGPLFFLIYVNDMVRASSEVELVLFADDTNIFARGKAHGELIDKVNRGLHELSKWFRCNRLTLNLKKTEYIFFGASASKGVTLKEVKIGDEVIRRVNGARFLGVWVDEKLRWTEHIENVRAKIGRLVGVLGRARASLGGSTLRMLYNGLVLPHLHYCLMVWGDFQEDRNKTLGDSLVRYQKRIVGMIDGKIGSYHADPVFGKLGILKLEDLYKQQLRNHAWKFTRGILPRNQLAMFQSLEQVHRYGTRSSKQGHLYSSQDHRSIKYRLPKVWEDTGVDIRDAGSLAGMKNRSKKESLGRYLSFQCGDQSCYACGRIVGSWLCFDSPEKLANERCPGFQLAFTRDILAAP